VELARFEEFKQLARDDRKFFLKDHLQHKVIAVYGTHIGMISNFVSVDMDSMS